MNSLVSYIERKSIVSYVYFTEAMHDFKNDQRGVTAVEYAVMAAGVAAIVTVVFGDGGVFDNMLTDIFTRIQRRVTQVIPD